MTKPTPYDMMALDAIQERAKQIPESVDRLIQMAEDVAGAYLDAETLAHSRRVADASAAAGGDDSRILGLLHDVVEDSKVTMDWLRSMQFPEWVVNAVDALTHRPNEPNLEYWARVSTSRLARIVKIMDITDNLARPLIHDDPHGNERRKRKHIRGIRYLACGGAVAADEGLLPAKENPE